VIQPDDKKRRKKTLVTFTVNLYDVVFNNFRELAFFLSIHYDDAFLCINWWFSERTSGKHVLERAIDISIVFFRFKY